MSSSQSKGLNVIQPDQRYILLTTVYLVFNLVTEQGAIDAYLF